MQSVSVGAFWSAGVGNKQSRGGSYGSAIGIIRSVIDDVSKQVDRNFWVDRESYRQPDAVSEGDQRVRLITQVKYIAGLSCFFPLLMFDKNIKGSTRRWPGFMAALQLLLGTCNIQLD